MAPLGTGNGRFGGRGRTPVGVNIYFHALGLSTIAEGKPYATVKAVVSMFGVPDDSEPIHGFGAGGSREAGSESAAYLRRPSQRSGTP